MRGSSGRERSGAISRIEPGRANEVVVLVPRKRERGKAPTGEGEQVSWRRGKPGTNGIRSAKESEG